MTWWSSDTRVGCTLEKMVRAGFSPTEEFWAGFCSEPASRYVLANVGEVILGGDGASWIKGGSKLFGVDSCQLDRFHLARAQACTGDWCECRMPQGIKRRFRCRRRDPRARPGLAGGPPARPRWSSSGPGMGRDASRSRRNPNDGVEMMELRCLQNVDGNPGASPVVPAGRLW